MNVVAIRCQACDDIGLVEYTGVVIDGVAVPYIETCPLCGGSKVERPPVDHDKQARRIVEGETDENV
jgi:hypothetical protein